MDGENNGSKPYEQMDVLVGKNHNFWKHLYVAYLMITSALQLSRWDPGLDQLHRLTETWEQFWLHQHMGGPHKPTPPKFNKSPLENDGRKTILSFGAWPIFRGELLNFQGVCHVL